MTTLSPIWRQSRNPPGLPQRSSPPKTLNPEAQSRKPNSPPPPLQSIPLNPRVFVAPIVNRGAKPNKNWGSILLFLQPGIGDSRWVCEIGHLQGAEGQ